LFTTLESINAMSQSHLFCFGLGYTGMTLARDLMKDGWQVSGTCTDRDQACALTEEGIRTFVFDGDEGSDGEIQSALSAASHVLSTVPPSANDDEDPVLGSFGPALGRLRQLTWIGYLSTTGVYGDTGGKEVNENTPTAPTGPRGERRVKAENAWLSLYADSGAPIHIFRLPGIYGPGRSSFDQIKGGSVRRIHKPGHRFNRIHVADIVQTLRASMTHPHAGAIYNVCDDEAAPPADVTAHACSLLGVPVPDAVPFDEPIHSLNHISVVFKTG